MAPKKDMCPPKTLKKKRMVEAVFVVDNCTIMPVCLRNLKYIHVRCIHHHKKRIRQNPLWLFKPRGEVTRNPKWWLKNKICVCGRQIKLWSQGRTGGRMHCNDQIQILFWSYRKSAKRFLLSIYQMSAFLFQCLRTVLRLWSFWFYCRYRLLFVLL